jgi:hypothetical protein
LNFIEKLLFKKTNFLLLVIEVEDTVVEEGSMDKSKVEALLDTLARKNLGKEGIFSRC